MAGSEPRRAALVSAPVRPKSDHAGPPLNTSSTRRREGLGHDVDDTQSELPLGPVHEVQLQPA